MWIDAHCHLQLQTDGLESVVRAREAGVKKMVCVGTDPETSQEAVDMAVAAGEGVFAAIGLHPHDASKGLVNTTIVLEENLRISPNKVVAIGECGLDYYYEHSPRDVQREIFANQISLAHKHDLALVIHTRDAWDETFEILRSEGVPPRSVVHCFTGSVSEARIALDLGLLLSFSGIVTFKKSIDIQEAARFCPVDRMTVETDSPFLAPVPYRGKSNEPAYVAVVGQHISELKNTQVEAFADTVSRVTETLFGLS